LTPREPRRERSSSSVSSEPPQKKQRRPSITATIVGKAPPRMIRRTGDEECLENMAADALNVLQTRKRYTLTLVWENENDESARILSQQD